MKRMWNVFWLCCVLTFSAVMFAQAFGYVAWPKWIGFIFAAIILAGGAVHWRVNRIPRPTPP